jgi:hypothetical protein
LVKKIYIYNKKDTGYLYSLNFSLPACFIQLSCKNFVFFETFLKVGYGQHYFDILSQLAGERRVRSGDSPIKAPRRGWVAGVSPRYAIC